MARPELPAPDRRHCVSRLRRTPRRRTRRDGRVVARLGVTGSGGVVAVADGEVDRACCPRHQRDHCGLVALADVTASLPTHPGIPGRSPSEREVDPKGLVEFSEIGAPQGSDPVTHPLDGNGPHLFRLGLGVPRQPSRLGGQKHLEGVDPLDVRGHRHDSHHAAVEATGRGVGTVVADDHAGPTLGRQGPGRDWITGQSLRTCGSANSRTSPSRRQGTPDQRWTEDLRRGTRRRQRPRRRTDCRRTSGGGPGC